RDCASCYRAEMEGDEVGRVKHQHAHAIIGTNARLAQACDELADARRQRAIAQRFLGAQDRGMLGPGELHTVQQAILDRVHYLTAQVRGRRTLATSASTSSSGGKHRMR